MKLQEWYAVRGAGYIQRRSAALLDRYGLTSAKAVERVVEGVQWLSELGCAPTFPVPASVIQRSPSFFRSLQDRDVEICVHGFHHVALAEYTAEDACRQLVKAVKVFGRHGIQSHGFRCPYLSCSDEIIKALPNKLFNYSSNKAIAWNGITSTNEPAAQPIIAEVLQRVYKPASADRVVSVPSTALGMVEIPVNLPDDLELHDAQCLDCEEMGNVWSRIMARVHRRGEMFVLMYHPELMVECLQPLAAVLNLAASLHPAVWIARLRDISAWWFEKDGFSVAIHPNADHLQLHFACSERATILARDLSIEGVSDTWDGVYQRVISPVLKVPAEPRPLLGLYPGASAQVVSFLQEQGYLVDTGPTAQKCAIYLDAATLARLQNDVELVEHIEKTPGPLVRYGRWPNGSKSALSITGDLDALTLWDYAARLFVR